MSPATAPTGTFFLIVHPDGSLTTVDRRLRSTAHVARAALRILGKRTHELGGLGVDGKPTKVRRDALFRKYDGGKDGKGGKGVTLAFRDPEDVSFARLNPFAHGALGVAARGPVVAFGTDEQLHDFASHVTAVFPTMTMPVRLVN